MSGEEETNNLYNITEVPTEFNVLVLFAKKTILVTRNS